ncbi:MAG: hypothetical protein ACFBSC_17155 [Microcoleaceae cyanobacterium]
MHPEQIVVAFLDVLAHQSQLLMGEARHDLPNLVASLETVEFQADDEQLDYMADLLVDFCDVNPEVSSAVQTSTQKLQDQVPSITLETLEELILASENLWRRTVSLPAEIKI